MVTVPDVDVNVTANLGPDIRRLLEAVDPEPVWHEQGNRKVSRMVRMLRTSGEPQEATPPVSRSGARGFAGRFTYRVIHGGTVLLYGNAHVAARILALGGVIRMGAKMLTVPIADEARGRRAREFSNTFVRTGPSGSPIIFQRSGSGLRALYVLKESVRIREHPWGHEWDAVDNAALRKCLDRRVRRAEQQRRT